MSASVMALQIALGLGMVVLAVSVLFMRNLMASAVALAGFSLLLALEFYVLQAPDVAIAEAGIGAGLTTAIFMVAIRAVSAKGKKVAADLGGAASSRVERPVEQEPAGGEPVEETRQDAAPPEAEAAAPETPETPEVPEAPDTPEPLPPEKEAP